VRVRPVSNNNTLTNMRAIMEPIENLPYCSEPRSLRAYRHGTGEEWHRCDSILRMETMIRGIYENIRRALPDSTRRDVLHSGIRPGRRTDQYSTYIRIDACEFHGLEAGKSPNMGSHLGDILHACIGKVIRFHERLRRLDCFSCSSQTDQRFQNHASSLVIT
jgi:hypothetical protein